MNDRYNSIETMDLDRIREVAPSIFAEKAADHVSDRYQFIPTTRVIDALSTQGWHPVWAAQTRCRNEEGRNYTKHMLRFRNDSMGLKIDECFPEIVLTNAHDGLSVYRMMAGLFRLVCGNGMIVAESNFASIQVRHVGYDDGQILEASSKVIESVPLIANSVKRFQAIELSQDEQRAYAKSALTLRYDDDQVPFEVERLLNPRRYEDNSPSLWHTFNRVQENMIKGGVKYVKRDECGRPLKRQSTRSIKSVTENVKVNRALWTLTEEMAKIKSK